MVHRNRKRRPLARMRKPMTRRQPSLWTGHLYGIRLDSEWPLPGSNLHQSPIGQVRLRRAPPSVFPKPPSKVGWAYLKKIADGSDYLRWRGQFEFLVSPDGHQVSARTINGSTHESFQAYFLTQALSFALVKQGIEPLHATAVVIHGGVVAFAADCGLGKSTLAAAFLAAGYPLLTDDLLVTQRRAREIIAFPGSPRIKLFRQIAHRILGKQFHGIPMNRLTSKLIIPLNTTSYQNYPAPLRTIYILQPPSKSRVSIRSLSPRRALMALIANTSNPVSIDPARLSRQLRIFTKIVERVPVKSLSYPRNLSRLPDVIAAIEHDITLHV